MPTTPPALTAIPDFPSLSDRTTYNAKAFAWATAMDTVTAPELAALGANVYGNAVEADADATTATAQAVIATDKAVLTAADRAQTGLDRTATAADVVSTAALLDQFDDKYLGAKSADPTLDNDGNALQDGAFYISTVSGYLRGYTIAGGWVQGIAAVAGVSSVNGLTGAVTLKTINGSALDGAGDIVLFTPAIKTPSNVTPAASATDVMDNATLTGSSFLSLYGITMAAGQWQVSTVADFATTVISSGDVAGTATAYAMTAGVLAVSTVYYWRVRYKDADGVYSTWSTGTSFTTKASFNDYIAIPTATPAAFGDSLEGGFYSGMIWNELVQSVTSFAIGTGSKTFTVASMAATPLVYAGQTLEVRSRANPVNKMIGVVTAALGTALTINVTSVGGAGTFTDWSIMAQYRVIVAPKATGENAAIAYKNTNDAAPAACGTLSEGRKATLAMVAAGTSTVYPAAHWCNNLSIAGKTDWYLPARDELELCWRNLKPTADANYVVADRAVAATPNYMNLGSYGDTANTHGLDNNSSPVGAAHIAGTPAQVAAGKNFRTSEAEAFAYASVFYWSASEYSATSAWYQYWHSSYPGLQYYNLKTNATYVRAVRRSII